MNSRTSINSEITSKEVFLLKLFWASFTLYAVSNALVENPHVSEKLFQYLQLFSLLFIFSSSILLIKFRLENKYLKIIFPVYLLWMLITVMRGIHFDRASVLYMLLSANFGILLYFVPLIALFPNNLNFYKKIFNIIIVFAVFFFISDVLFIRELLERSRETRDVIERLSWYLALPSGFILLTYKYHSSIKKMFAALTIIVALLFSIYQARRGLSFILISTLSFSFFFYFFSTRQRVLVIYLFALLITLGLIYANSIYNISNNKLLNFIAERGEEDTRTGVELYFYNDMKTKDWIIGRGINGEYFCPGISLDTDYRSLIETGYLQIILKGGLIRLILYLLIMIPAAVLGLFASKNLLSKASACWIIITLISLYPATVESFDLQYIIVWVSVGICYSKKIRNYRDEYICNFLNNGSQLSN